MLMFRRESVPQKPKKGKVSKEPKERSKKKIKVEPAPELSSLPFQPVPVSPSFGSMEHTNKRFVREARVSPVHQTWVTSSGRLEPQICQLGWKN